MNEKMKIEKPRKKKKKKEINMFHAQSYNCIYDSWYGKENTAKREREREKKDSSTPTKVCKCFECLITKLYRRNRV